MASGSQNNTTYQAQKWTNLRAFTIGDTAKNVDGTAAVSWSKDEILGASTDAYFLRGDKVWSNTLNGVLLLPKGLKTGARVSDSGSGIVIDNDGGIEIFHTSTPFIDFHYQASTADYSVRLLCNSATNIHDSGSFTAGKYITAGGDVTANGGYLYSTLNGNTVQIGSQNGSYAHFTNTKDIPFWFNKVVQSDGGFTIYNTGDNHWRNGYIKINNSGGGDCYIELRRASNADWRVLNSGGHLYFQSNWTSAKGSYYNVLQLEYNSGNINVLRGNISISHATSTDMAHSSSNPKITFSESGGQPVHLIYTDYDSYRSPAGLKVVGGASASPAWFEVEGNIHGAQLHLKPAATSYGEGIRIHMASNNWCTIALCGTDNTGDTGTSANTWSIHNNSGNFYISRNNSSGGSGLRCVSNMWSVADMSTSSAAYSTAALQIREYNHGGAQTDNWQTAPRLGFHWSNRNAAQIGMASNGYLYECPGTGTTFYKLMYESGTWGISITGNATTCSYPLGFSSRGTGETWGNTTGTGIANWGTSTGGSIAFRNDNPSSGKLSIKVDGRFYGNEGTYPTMLMRNENGYWGLCDPDAANNVWIRTTTAGIIPYQSGGASAGHCGLGTSSWYFASAYIQNIYGYLHGNISGNAATATTLQTARNINGTSFNGSANITTANWGTARNFTIKDYNSNNAGTAVSVNGSGAVTLLMPSTIYCADVRSANTRIVSNWIGFYQNGNAGGNRYGYIQCDVNRMYFRKENSSSQTHYFDFGSAVYIAGELNSGGIRARGGMMALSEANSGNCAVWFVNSTNTVSYWKMAVQSDTNAFVFYRYDSGTINWKFRINSNGTTSTSSSRKIKHNIQDINFNTGYIIDRMKPVSYIVNGDSTNQTTYGFIYEDLVQVLPDVCVNSGGNVGITYTAIIPVLTKEIQNLRKRLAAVETELNYYRSKI